MEKFAKLIVEEIGSIAALNAMLEIGMRMTEAVDNKKIDPGVVGAFGFGCGGGCDAWGFGCGVGCLTGLKLSEEVIKYRFAIDVLGKKDITNEEMVAMRKDFKAFSKSVALATTEKLSLEGMKERIRKYGE